MSVPHEVKKQWGGKAQRIEPIQHAAVAFDHRAEIFHAARNAHDRHPELKLQTQNPK